MSMLLYICATSALTAFLVSVLAGHFEGDR